MKNHFYSFTVLLLFTFVVQVSKATAQQSDNYYTIRDSWISYFNANPQLMADTNEDGEYQEFMRWSNFWQNRVDHSNPALTGKLYNLKNAFSSYNQSIANLPPNVNPNPWSYCGPVNQVKQHNALISAIWVDTISDKHQKIIYAGTDASGIWKTTDGGLNWMNKTDASGFYMIGVNNIKGDPNDPNVIYAATGGGGICSGTPFGVGIISSTDAGATWNVIYSEQLAVSNYILVDNSNSNRLYIGFGNKVIRLIKIGSSWYDTVIYQDTCSHTRYIRDIEMKPGNPEIIYVATDDNYYGNRHASVVKLTGVSTGNTPLVDYFHPFCDSLRSERYEIAINPLTPNSLYLIGQIFQGNDSFVEIWKSVNSGSIWSKVFSETYIPWEYDSAHVASGGIGYQKLELLINPKDTNVIYVGGNAMSRLLNSNSVWSKDHTTGYYFDGGHGYHPDTRDAFFIRGGATGSHGAHDTIICGNDGGVSKTNNGIDAWNNLNGTGLWANEFWDIGTTEMNPFWIGGGTTHTGVFVNYFGKWESPLDGDVGSTIVDFEYPNIVYAQRGPQLNVSSTYGQEFEENFTPTRIDPFHIEAPVSPQPVVLNPKTSEIMYTGAYDLFRNNHMHNSKFDINTIITKIPVTLSSGQIDSSEKINCIAVSASDTGTILFSYGGFYGNDNNSIKKSHKLIKTTNSGASFVDLLALPGNIDLKNNLMWRGITSVAISPIDTSKMWVTLGGFSNWPEHRKVYYSSDGGKTFSDTSAGLPDFSVNCIRCSKNTDEKVFIGTDVGVFYKDNTLASWKPFNNGLPITMVTDIELLEDQEILRVSTYGRGVWQTYLYPCPTVNNNPLVIKRDTTWASPINMDRSIRVKAPATLTIKSRVRFPVMTKIMVEPGATLMCDEGCDLTNACTGMWLGIEVWGNSTLRQTTANQGVVSFRNGAIVENARIGITTCSKDINGNINWTTTGGIIHANNAIFRNNFKAIEFLSYPYAQVSKFINVFFETTGPFSDLGSKPQTFVSLLNITGLRFDACTFITKSSNPYFLPSIDDGIGITSINAGFMVNGQCLGPIYPCTKWTPSRFEGLYYGIKAQNTDPVKVVSIDRCNFTNNLRGCYFSGVPNPAVTSTEFLLPQNVNYPHDFLDGLYLDECTGSFNVQENHFHIHGVTDLNSIGSYYGLIVNNSGPEPKQIYNNQFDTLDIGILAQLMNRNLDGSTGLCLKCNRFSKTRYDQAVTGDDIQYPGQGIARTQGTFDPNNPDVKSPAGNTFSSNHLQLQGVSDISNGGGSITYTHHQNSDPYYFRVRPDYHSASVSLNPAGYLTWKKDSACPSQLNVGGGIPDLLKSSLSAEDSQIASLTSQLSLLVDGGNTDATNADILFSTPPEAMELHDDLLNLSPYLSDTVMKSSIAKEAVLPNALIRDILVANPQSAKSEDILSGLNNRVIPMQDSMMSEILSGKDIVGLKEQLEGKIFEHQLLQNYYLGEIIRSYSQDTTGINATDSIISILQNRSDLNSKYLLAFEYLSDGQIDRVNEVLMKIINQFQLTDEQLKEYQNYSSYLYLLGDLQSQNLTIYDLNSDQINQLRQLQSEASEPVRTYARNVMLANNLLSYEEPIYLPDETKSAPSGNGQHASSIITNCTLELFPNPANQYVIAKYDFPIEISSKDNLSISVASMDGKIMLQKKLNKTSDQVLIDCRSLKAGIHLCNLSSGKKILVTAKFLILQ